MKIKKSILILITSLVAVTNMSAEKFVSVCQKISKVNIVRGQFELTQNMSKTGTAITSSGDYTISSKDGMIWFTNKPVESVMAVTTTYMIQEMKGRMRKIDGSKSPTFTYMGNTISSLFTGNYEEIEKNFEVSLSNVSGEQNLLELILEPKDDTIKSYIKSITVKIKELPDLAHITEIKMNQFNGDSSVYRLKNQVVTDTLNANEAKYFEN